MGWKTDVYSDVQKTYMKLQEDMNHSDSEVEMTARLFRGYDRFCIRQGLTYVEDMTDTEFDDFARFLAERSHVLIANDVKMLKKYFAFLRDTNYIADDVCKNRLETIDKVAQVNSRSKFKKASDFTADGNGKDLIRFFYVSPEHFVNDVAAISPSRDYSSAIVIMIFGWCGLTALDVTDLMESQVSSDCSVIHIDDRDIMIPDVMQQILRDYRESDVEFLLPDSGNSITKVKESSLFIKKRKSGSREATGKNYNVTNTITTSSIQQRAREFSDAISAYHQTPIALTIRKMNTFARLYEMDKRMAVRSQSIIPFAATLGLTRAEQTQAIRLLTERKAFIETNEDVKPFLQY